MQRPPRYQRPRQGAVVAVVAVAVLVVVAAVAWAVHRTGAQDAAAGAGGARPASITGPTTTSTPAGASTDGGTDGGTEPATSAAPTPPEPGTAPGSAPASMPPATPAGIDLAAHSTSDPASLWVVVNKQHPIEPLDHEPTDLVTVDGARVRQVVRQDLEAMLAGAQADGVRLGLRTGYRSYGAQAAIRADVEARRGFAHAEKYSARPGYSEHQTGLAFDLHGSSQPGCDLQTCFADTAEGRWVAAHAAEYGFLVRYTPENTATTGFSPEAWHLRYVGRELAGWMAAQGVGSLEEALGVTGGPDYAAGT